MKSGHVAPLPKKVLSEVIALLKDRPSPAILAEIDPEKSGNVGARIASLLSRGKISVRVVDLGPEEGFRRENARPTCEVLLVEKDGEVLWEGKNRFRTEPAAFPRVFLPKAFLERNASRPHVVYQAIVHPILEWVFGYPHMIAVLCESAYNATPPDTAGSLSDLNRYIAEGAGRDSDFPYFDRILVDAYEPEDFRKRNSRTSSAVTRGRWGRSSRGRGRWGSGIVNGSRRSVRGCWGRSPRGRSPRVARPSMRGTRNGRSISSANWSSLRKRRRRIGRRRRTESPWPSVRTPWEPTPRSRG